MIPPPWRQQRPVRAPAYIPVAVPNIFSQPQVVVEAAPLQSDRSNFLPAQVSPKRRQIQDSKMTTEQFFAEGIPPRGLAEEDGLELVEANFQDTESARAKRAKRFAQTQVLIPPPVSQSSPSLNHDVMDWDSSTIVGYSTALEKRYFRLTSAPDPSTVRPLPVLEKSFALLKSKWSQEQNYSYICDQFKSLRQDLTVQRIKNKFVVLVYETHARIALEKADWGEFNQCATQLQSLYNLRLGGHPNEFLAYRILYLLQTANKTDMNDVILYLTAEDARDPIVDHAMKVRKALMSSNYYSLFKLYDYAPGMSGYLMDRFIKRERITALTIMCKAYRPTLSLAFVVSQLGFENEGECRELLTSLKADSFLIQNGDLLTQTALPVLQGLRREVFPVAETSGLL